MRVLGIDIGGTKTALALCELSGMEVTGISGLTTLISRDFRSLETMIHEWQQSHPSLVYDAVGAGVAGPVVENKVHLTNLGWSIDGQRVSEVVKKPVFLCNDMRSHGWGIVGMREDDRIILNAGIPREGAKALIAAGTGLGESIIPWAGGHHLPMGGEGGHATFGPSSEIESELHRYLRGRIGEHVSWERVLGGFDGFRNLILFWREQVKVSAIPEWARSLTDLSADWGAALIQAGGGGDPMANDILSFYATLYGKEAGNLALKCLPFNGLYIGGGIAPRIRPWLEKYFMKGFTDKGRFAKMMESIPVYVVMDPLNGLKGAALQCERNLP
jgi:glucokinase